MQQWGYFKGDWLNGPVCWHAPGLPMMNGQTQGLYAGIECFAGLCSVTLVQNMKKIHSPGLIDDQSTWTLTSRLCGGRVEQHVETIGLLKKAFT